MDTRWMSSSRMQLKAEIRYLELELDAEREQRVRAQLWARAWKRAAKTHLTFLSFIHRHILRQRHARKRQPDDYAPDEAHYASPEVLRTEAAELPSGEAKASDGSPSPGAKEGTG